MCVERERERERGRERERKREREREQWRGVGGRAVERSAESNAR